MIKYPNILQQNEEDCGAACLASVAKYYGRIFTITRIRDAVGTGQLGTTLLGMIRGAEALGLNARGVKVSPEILDSLREMPLPAVIHWKGCHYVVFYGKRGRRYVVADPAVGTRYISRQELLAHWTQGVTLLLEPDASRFYQQENDRLQNLGRFLHPVWNYRGILGQALLINLALGLLSLSLPFLIQFLTDDVLIRGDRSLLNGIITAVVIMQVLTSGLQLVQFNLIAHFAQRIELNLVLDFGRKLLRLPLRYFESHRSGEIVSRLRDIEEINQLIAQVFVSWPSQLFVAAISLGIMVIYSPKLMLLVLGTAAVMSASTLTLWPVLKQRIRSLLVLEAETQGVLVETFKGAITVKTTSAAPQFWQELQTRFGRLSNLIFRTTQISIFNRTFSGFISRLGTVSLLWFGSHLVIAKDLSIGQLLAFNVMAENFLAFVSFAIYFTNDCVRVSTATQRLSEVIDAAPESNDDTLKSWVNIPDAADIACMEVTFHHAGRVDLLSNFSLTIPGGQVIALIGKSGCGKSTLAKLIASLYTLQSGNIRIGPYNLQDIALDCRRQQIVLVPQEPHFWSRSILENFRLSAPQVTLEQVVRACQIAEADEFISRLPDQYQTILGEFGANISGGQRQRLAIARALIHDPPVLILDESTAGLDPVSEAQVLERILAVRQGKTTILISHRPRVIERADWLIFLDQGQLVLAGTPADLRTKMGEHLEFLKP